MTDKELWMQAYNAASEALQCLDRCPQVGIIIDRTDRPFYTEARRLFQLALCAVTELERRAAGVEPPKQGD